MKLQAAALSAMVLLLSPPAGAVLTDLTPMQVEEAIEHGKKSYERMLAERRPIDDLEPEYVVDLGPETGKAMLFTEFSTVVLEARRWQAIGRPMTLADVADVIMPVRDRVIFSVVLEAPNRDYLLLATPSLVQRDQSVKPTGWDVHRGTPKPSDPKRFVVAGRYTFSAKGLDLESPVALVLRAQDGREVRFEFDLKRVR